MSDLTTKGHKPKPLNPWANISFFKIGFLWYFGTKMEKQQQQHTDHTGY